MKRVIAKIGKRKTRIVTKNQVGNIKKTNKNTD